MVALIVLVEEAGWLHSQRDLPAATFYTFHRQVGDGLGKRSTNIITRKCSLPSSLAIFIYTIHFPCFSIMTRTLLSLPNEVLLLIALQLYPTSPSLCYNCHNIHDPRDSMKPSHALGLAMTCTLFHRLFQQLTRPWLHVNSKNWLHLCRLIIEQPVALDHIQFVHFQESYCELQFNISQEQLRTTQEFLNNHHFEFQVVLSRVIRPDEQHRIKYTSSNIATYGVFFFLSALPNVRRVLLSPTCIAQAPRLRLNILPNVTDLQFHHNGLQCDRHQIEARRLFSAMPYLTSLWLADLDERDADLQHPNIKHLTLANTGLSIRGLNRLLEGFPNLQSLEYIPDPEEWRERPVISRRLSKVLRERCPNLEELSLDFSSIVRRNEDLRVAPCNLLSLGKLKRLQLRGFSFPMEVARHLQRQPLSQVLPWSIEDLTIVQSTNNQLILELLQVVSDSPLKFPQLKRISLGRLHVDAHDCASIYETGERLAAELRQSCSEARIALDCNRLISPSCA